MATKPHFRTHDPDMTARFEALIGDLQGFCAKVYPGEAMAVRLLRADVRLFQGNAAGVLDLVSYYVARPYVLEDNPKHFLQLVELFAQAHLLKGTLHETGMSFIALGRWFAAYLPWLTPVGVGVRMAPFVAFGRSENVAAKRSAIIRWVSRAYVDCLRHRSNPLRLVLTKLRSWLLALVLGVCYLSLVPGGRNGNPFSLARNRQGRVLVTRAMGGIGDLLMMAPGLEASARITGQPVDFAIPSRFFEVFEHNPHVNLIDIDGPPIDISLYRKFFNLGICPAGRYESARVPHVDKGRVEIFAAGMGIRRKALEQQGWKINHFLSRTEERFCDEFLAQRGIGQAGGGNRQLVGVQPFSRDSYKDHPAIGEIIQAIAKHYDVLIFHHLPNGLPDGTGIHTTAGVPLGCSLGLVSRLDAIVTVDSAFLHAAAAFDVPAVAMFGPTDGQTFTRHHKRAKILCKQDTFACVPCWRNEDKPCFVSGLLATSPCMAAIRTEEVLSTLNEMLVA